MSRSGIGTVVSIATGVPATFDKAGYDALAKVPILNAESIGGFSVTDALIEVPNLQSGFTKAIKGARSGSEVAIPYEGDGTDPGQAALKAAADALSGEYSIIVAKPDGTTSAASGLLYSFQRNDESTSDYEGGSATFRLNYAPVDFATA